KLRGLVLILEIVFTETDGVSHAFHYRMVLEKARNKSEERGAPPWEYSIAFWCLYPAVIFSMIQNSARTVILTSGTLSPMSSFASELGSAFECRLEGGWSYRQSPSLGTQTDNCLLPPPPPPHLKVLRATYEHFEKLPFQDELGNTVLNLIETIPEGVLIFMPSYLWLDKWNETGLLAKMSRTKKIFVEPRSNANGETDALMEAYSGRVKTGAMLLCVQRGKDSRVGCSGEHSAVATPRYGWPSTEVPDALTDERGNRLFGIPYPNTKDVRIKQKRDYNNMQLNGKKGMLSGSLWYEIQAFRALNQSLGRCIRHRKDWGAIILIDARWSPATKENLSKWDAAESLRQFYRRREVVEAPAPMLTPRPALAAATAAAGMPTPQSAVRPLMSKFGLVAAISTDVENTAPWPPTAIPKPLIFAPDPIVPADPAPPLLFPGQADVARPPDSPRLLSKFGFVATKSADPHTAAQWPPAAIPKAPGSAPDPLVPSDPTPTPLHLHRPDIARPPELRRSLAKVRSGWG
ncbi:helicase C-terminal domain-containing protein, partial [Blyttiomyces helicus]